MARVRFSIEVVAGIIPGTPDPKHTKQFHITEEEWDREGPKIWLEKSHEAAAYAAWLQYLCMAGREVNWTRIDYIWY